MRIRTMTGLAFAGAAAVVAVVAGGAAYAGDETDPAPVVRIVTEDEGAQSGAVQWSREDCPEKGGDGSSAPGGSGAPEQPATPEQPAVPQESL